MPRNNNSRRKPQAPKPYSSRGPGHPRHAHQVRVRSLLRREPDVRRIARAVIQLALTQAEREAGLSEPDAAPPKGAHETAESLEVSS